MAIISSSLLAFCNILHTGFIHVLCLKAFPLKQVYRGIILLMFVSTCSSFGYRHGIEFFMLIYLAFCCWTHLPIVEFSVGWEFVAKMVLFLPPSFISRVVVLTS